MPAKPPAPQNVRTIYRDKPLISLAGKTPNRPSDTAERKINLFAWLSANPGATYPDMRRAVKMTRQTMSAYLNEWMAAGKVTHTPEGRNGRKRILKKWSVVK
jgi:predicted HTH transcriptional regulator